MQESVLASVIRAWGRLIRAERTVVGRIEAELKSAGFPSLHWYDVLLELKRGPEGRLTPREIEDAGLFEQYNLSRLLDRMEAEGLVRRIPLSGRQAASAGRDHGGGKGAPGAHVGRLWRCHQPLHQRPSSTTRRPGSSRLCCSSSSRNEGLHIWLVRLSQNDLPPVRSCVYG